MIDAPTRYPDPAFKILDPRFATLVLANTPVQRIAVTRLDVAAPNALQVTPASLHVYEFDWSPDSNSLAYIAADPPGENNWWVAKLYTQTIGPSPASNASTSSNASTFSRASWWHSSHLTHNERTPFARMLASVIGGPR